MLNFEFFISQIFVNKKIKISVWHLRSLEWQERTHPITSFVFTVKRLKTIQLVLHKVTEKERKTEQPFKAKE